MKANQASEESTTAKESETRLSAEVVAIQIKSLALTHAVKLLSDQQDYATLQKLSYDLTTMLNHCVERFGLQQYSELFSLPTQTSDMSETSGSGTQKKNACSEYPSLVSMTTLPWQMENGSTLYWKS